MFGYIKPCTFELKVKEKEAYSAIYCGLCKQLGRVYGPFVRMTLSYDFAFLALLSIGVQEEAVRFTQERCIAHPLKRRNVCMENECLDRAAASATILLYYKLLDNLEDGGFFEKLLCLTALPFARRAFHKAQSKEPHIAQVVCEQMQAQAQLEKAHCACVDQASEPSGKILEAVLEELSDDPIRRGALRRMGYMLGRWVYLMDALDDLEDDIHNNNYNPFRYTESPDQAQEQAVASLYMTIAEIWRAYELVDVRMFEGILSNVVELGLKDAVDRLCKKKGNQTTNEEL